MSNDYVWPYRTAGIPDSAFDQIPGIPLSPREARVLLLSQLRLAESGCLWDIGAGTGTICVEAGLLCPHSQIIAIERDEDLVELIYRNCQKFGVTNVQVVQGVVPECLQDIEFLPDRICLEGGHPLQPILEASWHLLKPGGRIAATTRSLEGLLSLSTALAMVQARHVEVIQTAVYRLENRGRQQVLAALDPIFILSGEKGE